MKLAVPINVRSPKDIMDLCREISYLKVHAHVYFYVYCTNLSNYNYNCLNACYNYNYNYNCLNASYNSNYNYNCLNSLIVSCSVIINGTFRRSSTYRQHMPIVRELISKKRCTKHRLTETSWQLSLNIWMRN